MKLKYRGVSYNFTPTEAAFTGYFREGKYRGVPVRYPIFTADVPCPEVELSYRGVAYRAGQRKKAVSSVPVPVAATAPPETPTMDERVRRLMMNRHQQIRKREQSMLARMDTEVGLSVEDATHFHNHIQGYLPYNEWMDYERSHVAMS